jgi:hypothetical protein
MWAHTLGAVVVTILRITDTATNLVLVESTVGESLVQLSEFKVLVRELSGTKGELVDVLASTMPRAVIGARSTLAALSFITLKTFAFTSFTVAKTLTSAFSISMTSVVGSLGESKLGVVNPGELKGANSVGAITSITSHTQTPVIIAQTESAVTITMTTARIITSSRCTSNERKIKSSSKLHDYR